MSDFDYNKNSGNLSPESFDGEAENATAIQETSDLSDSPRFVAPTHSGVDILKLLAELEDLVEHTRRGPMGILFRFDDEKFHYLIMKIRANLPEEMKRASRLARDSERIVEETRDEAARITQDARESAQAQFSRLQDEESRIRETASAESRQLLEKADRDSARIQEEARKRAEEILLEARGRSSQLVSESEIAQASLRKAKDIQDKALQEAMEVQQSAGRKADELMARAEAAANAVRQGADEYARDVLSNLETILGKTATQVQRGRELLEGKR